MDISSLPKYSHVARRSFVAHGERELAPWTTLAARDGNPILPDAAFAVLREECAKFPGPVAHDEVFAIVLNNTAWRCRDLGLGLSRKSGGRHVTHPDPRVGDIAEDILVHTSGHHWDVFGGAAVGNPLSPGQGPSIGIIDLRARPWVAPVEPTGGAVTPPVTEPAPPATHPTVPQCAFQPCDCKDELAGLYEAIGNLRDDLTSFRQRQEDLEATAVLDRDNIKVRVERVSQEVANLPKPERCRLRF